MCGGTLVNPSIIQYTVNYEFTCSCVEFNEVSHFDLNVMLYKKKNE